MALEWKPAAAIFLRVARMSTVKIRAGSRICTGALPSGAPDERFDVRPYGRAALAGRIAVSNRPSVSRGSDAC